MRHDERLDKNNSPRTVRKPMFLKDLSRFTDEKRIDWFDHVIVNEDLQAYRFLNHPVKDERQVPLHTFALLEEKIAGFFGTIREPPRKAIKQLPQHTCSTLEIFQALEAWLGSFTRGKKHLPRVSFSKMIEIPPTNYSISAIFFT